MNKFYFIFAPIISGLLGIITVPAFTWFLLQEDLGRYNIFQSLLSIGTVFLILGLDQVLVREFYVLPKAIILNNILLPISLFSITVFLATYAFKESIWLNLFSSKSYGGIVLLFPIFLMNIYLTLLSNIFRMENKGLQYLCTLVLPKIFLLSLLFIYVYIDKKFETILLVYLGSLGLTFLSLSNHILTDLKTIKLKKFNPLIFKNFIKYGLPLVPSSIAFVGVNYSTLIILKKFVTLQQVAVFGVAMSFANIAVMIQTTIAILWTPFVFKQEVNDFKNFNLNFYINFMILLVIILYVVFAYSTNLVSYILPANYQQVDYLIIGCIIPSLIYCVSLITTVGIGITRKSYISLIASSIGLIINIILCFVLVPNHGVVGAIISNMLAYFATFVINTEFSSKIWHTFPRFKVYLIILFLIIYSILIISNFKIFEIKIGYYSVFLLLLTLLFKVNIDKKNLIHLYEQLKPSKGD